MGKLTFEDKINLYNNMQERTYKSLSQKDRITVRNVQYLCYLINRHEFNILRTKK